MKKIKNSQPQTKFTGSYIKKKSVMEMRRRRTIALKNPAFMKNLFAK